MEKNIGPCPVCGSDMIAGPSVDEHHLVPKSKKGREKEAVHVVCHRKLHSSITEGEMDSYFNTWERLRNHPEIARFIPWVRKQFSRDPEFIDVHRDTKSRKRKRGI